MPMSRSGDLPRGPDARNRKAALDISVDPLVRRAADDASLPILFVAEHLGSFCQISYRLTCLDARLLCRAGSHIARLCSCRCSLKASLNPAPSGTRFSGNRLKTRFRPSARTHTDSRLGHQTLFTVPFSAHVTGRAPGHNDRPPDSAPFRPSSPTPSISFSRVSIWATSGPAAYENLMRPASSNTGGRSKRAAT
jgi:hypothetical protein